MGSIHFRRVEIEPMRFRRLFLREVGYHIAKPVSVLFIDKPENVILVGFRDCEPGNP
jgi:hypothetical protein